MRQRPHDELLPLEVDGEDAPPEGRLVELGPAVRRRWRRRDTGLLLAAVALIALIGLTVDDGDEEEAAAESEPAATTTTARDRARRQPRTTTTRPPIGVPSFEEGDGPVLDGPTGSAVAFSDGNGRVTVLDLDTGSRCTVRLSGQGSWIQRVDGVRAYVYGGRPHAVAADCSVHPVPPGGGGDVFPADEPGRFWSIRWRQDGMRIQEIDDEGVAVGDAVPVPGFSGMARAVTGGVVVDVFGSTTFIDRETHTARHLGHGVMIAARHDLVAMVECQGVVCDVVVRDLSGHERGRVADVEPTNAWDAAALSPDGRLALLAAGDGDLPWLTVLDIVNGERRPLMRAEGSQVAFTADGRYVVTSGGFGLVAVPAAGGEATVLEDSGFHSFAVIARID